MCVCIAHTCMLSHCICVRLFVTLWTVAPPGSSVHGILQSRILEWVAMPSYIYICTYTYSKERIFHRLHFENALVSLSLMLDLLISFKWYYSYRNVFILLPFNCL